MGQYYHSAILADDKKTVVSWVYSHDIKERFKGYDGRMHTMGSGLKLMEHSYLRNKFVNTFESLILNNPQRVVWGGDYADNCDGLDTNVFDRCEDNLKVIPTYAVKARESRYIVNHTTRQFVDKTKVINNGGWKIHPLPLLTCEGNGRGGGDYRIVDGCVGIWARDVISVQSTKPNGFEEIIPKFSK
jgi:hypothetical protein